MVGVPAFSAATTFGLFLLGILAVGVAAFVVRARLRGLGGIERLVTAVLALSLTALPLLGWRIVGDLRTTTKLDAYERASMGPIQAYLPGYLVDGARARIPAGGTWAVAVGPSGANPLARKTFPELVLVSLFPRVSAPLDRAGWVVAWGIDPSRVTHVVGETVVHPRQGPLPPVVVGRRR